jgi:hypothetical protein
MTGQGRSMKCGILLLALFVIGPVPQAIEVAVVQAHLSHPKVPAAPKAALSGVSGNSVGRPGVRAVLSGPAKPVSAINGTGLTRRRP